MEGVPASRDRRRGKFPWGAVGSVLLFIGVVRALTLGLPVIGGSPEAREALVIDVIVRGGSWIFPLPNGIVPPKPPLFHWLGASLSLVGGGMSEFFVRLPSLIACLVVLGCSALIAFCLSQRRPFGADSGGRYAQRAAMLAMGILSLIFQFHHMAALATVDMVFSACVWGALAALCSLDLGIWRSERRISTRSKLLFWLCSALAAMTSGLVAGLLPVGLALIGGVFVCGSRIALRQLWRSWPWWFLALLPVTWGIAAYQVGGEAFPAGKLHSYLLPIYPCVAIYVACALRV